MFSGIVEEYAEVVKVVKDQENLHLTLKCSFVDELKIDQSVSHNGVCLTVVSIQDGTYTVTAMKETIERSNIGLLAVGDKVNVERSMMPKELYIRYWGTFRTTCGRNRVEIMMPNSISRPLNLKRLKP